MISHPSITNAIYSISLYKRGLRFCEGAGASYQDQQFRSRLFYLNPSIKIIPGAKYFYIQHKQQSVLNLDDIKINAVISNIEEEKKWYLVNKFDVTIFNILTCKLLLTLYKKSSHNQKNILGALICNLFKTNLISIYHFLTLKDFCYILFYILMKIRK